MEYCQHPNCHCPKNGEVCPKGKRVIMSVRRPNGQPCQWRAMAWKDTTCLGSRIYTALEKETVYGLAKRDFHGCDYVYVTPIKTVYRGVNANIG